MFSKIGKFFKSITSKINDFLFKNRYGTVMTLVGIIIAFWDLILKDLLDGKNFQGIKGVFSIFSTHNTGGAWSIFPGNTLFLVVITIVFIIGIIIFNFMLKKKNYFYAISMGLLLSGAVCNLFDRIKFGYVRDFIKLDFINFPIFNIADIAITFGVILLCIYFVFIIPKMERAETSKVDANAHKIVEKYELNKNEENVEINTDKSVKKVEKTKKQRTKNGE